MAVTRLVERRVEKVWCRLDLPPPFGPVADGGEPVGEIWFENQGGEDLPLLVKYLFTSEKLSVQVHPDDLAAREAGHRHGKDEAWLVLEAERGATIGLGLKQPIGKDELRAAAQDGSIESLLDWRPAAAGDFYYSPAGTVHAIGPGVSLIEIQQNVDLTYRLYDYGRPRELHLDEAIEAADPGPYRAPMNPYALGENREILAEGRAFVLERWRGEAGRSLAGGEDPVWLIMVSGKGTADGQRIEPGSVWIAEGPAAVRLDAGAELFLAYPGPRRA
jgi:mannose-6-phosphate isomerase